MKAGDSDHSTMSQWHHETEAGKGVKINLTEGVQEVLKAKGLEDPRHEGTQINLGERSFRACL